MKTTICLKTRRASAIPTPRTLGLTCVCLAWLVSGNSLPGQDLPRFREQVISTAVKFGYQLIAVDLNGDGKKDLIAIDERAAEVAWFENPTWNGTSWQRTFPGP